MNPEDTEGETLRNLGAGHYLTLDMECTLVRSTICVVISHDDAYIASTHGDHAVRIFEYPEGQQIVKLQGHPRTPWSVCFHPTDSNIVASACLGGECRIWNVARQECIRVHKFDTAIACVCFNPIGSMLALAVSRSVLIWDYKTGSETETIGTDTIGDASLPRQELAAQGPLHVVSIHPSGSMLITGEKNPQRGFDYQFTLAVTLFRLDSQTMKICGDPILKIPRVIAYNDAGIHISPCGRMLAVYLPGDASAESSRIAIISLVATENGPVGSIEYQTPLDEGYAPAVTCLKFSPTSSYLLVGLSFRSSHPLLQSYVSGEGSAGVGPNQAQIPVLDIFRVGEDLERVKRVFADLDFSGEEVKSVSDELNCAIFGRSGGISNGIVYGTQRGRVRHIL